MAKVQVVMPSYNRPKTVQRSIKSVLNQTFKDWSLYIMDNSSDYLWPRMKEIYSQYAKNDGRIKIDHMRVDDRLRFKTWYVSVVTNKALFEISEQEPYVVLTTDDNVMMPNKLEVLSKFLDSHPEASIVAGVMKIIDGKGQEWRRYGGTNVNWGVNFLDWCQPMYRRSLINKVGRFVTQGSISIDKEYYKRVAKFAKPIFGIGITLDRTDTRFYGTRFSELWKKRLVTGGLMEPLTPYVDRWRVFFHKMSKTWGRTAYQKCFTSDRSWLHQHLKEPVLDVGCGTCLDACGFTRYVGVDITKSFLKEAHFTYQVANVSRCDARQLPFKDKAFQSAFSKGLLLHYLQKEGTKIIWEMLRVSKETYVAWGFGVEAFNKGVSYLPSYNPLTSKSPEGFYYNRYDLKELEKHFRIEPVEGTTVTKVLLR